MIDLSSLPPLGIGARAGAVRETLARLEGEATCDALLLTDLTNVRWLTGFTGSAARAVLLPDEVVLVTDGRYGDQASAQLSTAGVDGRVLVGLTQSELREHVHQLTTAIGRLGFEAEQLSVAEHGRLAAALSSVLVPTSGVVESRRRAKDPGEVARIEAACALAGVALADVLAQLATEPTEAEFALALERRMEDLGAEGPSFPTIVASGPNAARPHHRPGSRRVTAGETIVIDFGALVDGYHSDMTRTVILGSRTPVQGEVFEVVRAAQAAGVAAVAAGVPTQDVDRTCRDAIVAAGWGDWFTHGTGHGVGLLIHETPWLSRSVEDVLRPADVVTVEPGVYRGDFGGVRIEDTVVVMIDGSRTLTLTPKDL
jgi:Xaa-Pro aminopeptidase